MFITLEIALLWKVLPEPSLKWSVLMRPSAGGILKKTRALHSFPIIVHSGALLSMKVHHLVLRTPSVWKARPEIKVLWLLTKITKESTRRAEQIPGNVYYPLCGLSRRIILKLEAWNGTVKSSLLGNMLLVAIENHLRLWGEGPGMFSDILPSSFNDSNSGQQVRSTWAAC